ncbi:MAG: tRNA (adenosine(37)-N6)-dimethylallyltransferase MiaA [Bacillota bacterium]|nr:tRNA (adenosine(37)-N6)-dimethylallyltransferase MiaA [Bacillota bacterium]
MKVHFVIGPTASGKSDYAVNLAIKLQTEIIGADSVQVYREFDIGSAKIRPEEMKGIRHHLIDVLDPRDAFTVMDYEVMARKAIEDVFQRTGTAIVCGGTGFYINALLYRLDKMPSPNPTLRDRLNEMTSEDLLNYAESLGMTLERVDRANKRRVIRAVEVFQATGRELGHYRDLERTDIDPVFHYILPDRSVLYERINFRVDRMLEAGLIEETRRIVREFGKDLQALGSIGYKEVCQYLQGNYDETVLREEIKKNTRHYAKRQITWFNRVQS